MCRETGGRLGACNFVGESGMSVPLLMISAFSLRYLISKCSLSWIRVHSFPHVPQGHGIPFNTVRVLGTGLKGPDCPSIPCRSCYSFVK